MGNGRGAKARFYFGEGIEDQTEESIGVTHPIRGRGGEEEGFFWKGEVFYICLASPSDAILEGGSDGSRFCFRYAGGEPEASCTALDFYRELNAVGSFS